MFKIIAAPNEPDDFGIFFNNKFIDEAYFDTDSNCIENDDYADFDIQKLRNIKTVDFPDNFQFRFSPLKPQVQYFYLFELKRKGKGIIIAITGGFNVLGDYEKTLTNLLWNPVKFVKAANKIAESRNIDLSKFAYDEDNDEPSLDFIFYFPVKEKETLGNLFDIVFKETAVVLHDAEVVLFNEAAKRLEKKKQQGKNY